MHLTDEQDKALAALKQAIEHASNTGLLDLFDRSAALRLRNAVEEFESERAYSAALALRLASHPLASDIAAAVRKQCFDGAFGILSRDQAELMAHTAARDGFPDSTTQDAAVAVELLWVD